MTTLRARFDGKVLIPEGPVNLPTDRVLEVEVHVPAAPAASALTAGSPAAILEAMGRPPHLSREDLQALEQAIAAGKLPVSAAGVFDDRASGR